MEIKILNNGNIMIDGTEIPATVCGYFRKDSNGNEYIESVNTPERDFDNEESPIEVIGIVLLIRKIMSDDTHNKRT